jgi:hypothetical protein
MLKQKKKKQSKQKKLVVFKLSEKQILIDYFFFIIINFQYDRYLFGQCGSLFPHIEVNPAWLLQSEVVRCG